MPEPTPTPPTDPAPTPTDPAPTDPPTDPKPPADPPVDPDPGKGGKDAILADLAKERDKRQELEGKLTEFQTQQQAQMDAIAKALGLKQDEPPDPEKLAAQVSEEQARARDAQVQLAVYRRAGTAEANANALLDSAKFLASLKDVDPTDEAAVDAAIKAAVEANPLLKAATPTPPFPGGPRPPAPTQAGTLGEAITKRVAGTR